MNAGRGRRFFSSPSCPVWPWGPPNFLFIEYLGSLWGVRRERYEVGHSSGYCAKVKTEESCTSAPCLCFHGMDRD
jgi:hypothetical protein